MRFAPSPEQLEIAHAVRLLLAARCTPGDVRAATENEQCGYDADLWKALAEMGVLGLLAPASADGLGLSFVEMVLVLEEAGRAALPGPLLEHAAVAVPALAAAADDRLAAAVRGEQLITAATGGRAVAWAADADFVIIEQDGRAGIGSRPVVEPRRVVDRTARSYRIAEVALVDLPTVLISDLNDRGALGTAAQLLGLAERMLEMTVSYVKQRKQFGVAIGAQQAVKHHLADARVALEYARPVVWRAAYALANHEPDRSRDCSFAKVYAASAADRVGRTALQCHGAIGYTFEHDLQLWLKRTWALMAAWGTTDWHRSRVADAVLQKPASHG